jgi:Tol biopolymer transport system component
VPPPGDDAVGTRLGWAALSLAIAIGQSAQDGGVFVTVPLRQADGRPSQQPRVSVSADGRFAAFVSAAPLAPADVDDQEDVYVLDRESGAVSLESAGTPIAVNQRPVLSGTGRYLIYETITQGLILRDRESGAARPLQRSPEPPNGSSRSASISGDGRYIAFSSGATNLVDGPDLNGAAEDVYVVDTASMMFHRIGPGASGEQVADATSFSPAISADGRFVAFSSTVRQAGSARRGLRTINTYRHDRQTGITMRVSVTEAGGPPDGSSYTPVISGDGRFVAFVSEATNLIRHDANRLPDVYLRDMAANVTELISRTRSGQPANGPSRYPEISEDGRIVVFQSEASDLTCGERCAQADRDINLVADIFRRDRAAGVTALISRGRTPWMEPSIGPAIDRTGAVIVFASRHPLDRSDDRHDYDLFLWSRHAERDSAR